LPRLPRVTAEEAETRLLQAGFTLIRSKGSHRAYIKDQRRIILPFHSGKVLHPKILKQVFQAIEEQR
jgi:predicted RNA binding protein YcfA (HicA-like mRNA interferase family)